MPYAYNAQLLKTSESPTHRGAQHGGLKIGDHICAFHKTQDDYINATKSFILDGIANNQKTIFLSGIYHQEDVFKKVEDEEVSIQYLCNTQQIEIYDIKDTYLKGGAFNPNYVSDLLIEKGKESLAHGYSATRVAGTGCKMAGCVDHGAWVNYERTVSMGALKELNLIGVCNYFIDSLPGPLLNQIIESHPLCQFGEDLLVNPNYPPLDLEKTPDPAKAEFEFRLNKMYEYKQREDIIFGLYKKTQKLSEFSHMLSHELKAPIRTASVLGEMISSQAAGEGDELHEELLKSLKTAYDRLESVEALSSITVNPQKKNRVDLKDIIENIVCDQLNINEGRILVDRLKNHSILADQTQIHQILHNLIENAIKYKREDTPLEISISMEVSPQKETTISIKDNGRGTDPKFHGKIFMPFVRLTTPDLNTEKERAFPFVAALWRCMEEAFKWIQP